VNLPTCLLAAFEKMSRTEQLGTLASRNVPRGTFVGNVTDLQRALQMNLATYRAPLADTCEFGDLKEHTPKTPENNRLPPSSWWFNRLAAAIDQFSLRFDWKAESSLLKFPLTWRRGKSAQEEGDGLAREPAFRVVPSSKDGAPR
jgi:hypothetical protein